MAGANQDNGLGEALQGIARAVRNKELKVKPFSGDNISLKKKGSTWIEWIKKLEDLFEQIGIDENEDKIREIRSRLKGQARHTYNDWVAANLNGTWLELKTEMKNHYHDRRLKEKARAK
jgi:hypothetical protein